MASRKRHIAILVVVLALILGVGPLVQWRLRAVAYKLAGRLPGVTWPQVASLFGSYWDVDVAAREGLVVLAEQTDAEECSARLRTPVGEMWADFWNEGQLELLFKEQVIDRIYHNSTVGLEPGDVVLDVGSHLGTFTLFALDQGAARVVAFEPDGHRQRCYEKTFAAEIRAGKVTLIKAAAWREATTLYFDGHVSESDEPTVARKIEVPAVTIDDTVEELRLDRVDFVKMDIEGAEVDALLGARRTLAAYGPRMSLSIYHNRAHRTEVPSTVLAARPAYRYRVAKEFAYFFP